MTRIRCPNRSADDMRRREIATIQIGRQQLQMEDCAYRAMIGRVSAEFGACCTSSAKLDQRQRQAVIAELQRLGANKPTRPKGGAKQRAGTFPGRPRNMRRMPEMITKIEALLTDMRLPWSYADAICRRQTGIDRVSWCRNEDGLRGVIAALHVEQKKRAASGRIDAYLKHAGIVEAELLAQIDGRFPANWRRVLKLVAAVDEWVGRLTSEQGHRA